MSAARPLHAVSEVSFGERLRAERLARGHTQQQAGEKLGGVRQQTVGAWEGHTERPQVRHFDRIIEYLHLEDESQLRELLEVAPTAKSGAGPRASRRTPSAPSSTLDSLASALADRIRSGPPLSNDEARLYQELVAALR